jgi:C-terminal processing protease CtpA/Prc
MDSIYTINNKKAGYIVFNEFLGEPSQIELAKTINRFEANGVTDLIIDLRYNLYMIQFSCE